MSVVPGYFYWKIEENRQSTGHLQVREFPDCEKRFDVSFQALNRKATDLKKTIKLQIFNFRNLQNVFLDSLRRAT